MAIIVNGAAYDIHMDAQMACMAHSRRQSRMVIGASQPLVSRVKSHIIESSISGKTFIPQFRKPPVLSHPVSDWEFSAEVRLP